MQSSTKKTLGLSFLGVLFVTCGLILYFDRYPVKLPPDMGTVLVYEIDDGDVPSHHLPEAMAEALRSRVDPAGDAKITVRPVGARQLEMRIPRREDHENRVEDIKELAGHRGDLEFRILADEVDDPDAVDAASRYFAEAKADAAIHAELERRNATGDAPPPPPFPTNAGFVTKKGMCQYEWLKLGRNYQRDLSLDDASENARDALGDTNSRRLMWLQAADARQDGTIFQRLDMPGRPYFFSRTVHETRRDGAGKNNKYEYFVLARKTETPKENPGRYIEIAAGIESSVHFRLSAHGGDLLRELTQNNANHQMACVLDGYVMSTANIKSTISTDGEITGRFTDEQVARLAAVLCAGPLPAPLKPVPVSENAIKQWWRIW